MLQQSCRTIAARTLFYFIIDSSSQFGAVGYIITPYSSKSYVKSWVVRPNFGEVLTSRPPTGCAHDRTHFIVTGTHSIPILGGITR